jgi:hypothetical protein
MTRGARWAAVFLLAAACGGGGATPPVTTPGPSTPAPGAVPSPGAEVREPAGGRGPAVRYPRKGSGRLRYAFLRRDSIEVTMPSGEQQLQQTGSTAWLTLTWTAADSGTRIEAVVDSVMPDPDFPPPGLQLDSARFARWTLRQAPTGEITAVDGGPQSLRADQVRDQLLLLFPILPEDGARAGMEWRDSTSAPTRLSAFPAEASILVHSRAEAAPGNGLRLVSERTRNASGEGTLFGQAIMVRATGTDSVTTDLDAEGKVREAEVRRVTDFVVELSAIGQTVPGREVTFLRMTPVP